MEQFFDASVHRRSDELRSAIPPHSLAAVTVPEYVVNPIKRESSPSALTYQLPERDLAIGAHVSGSRVADVRVVCPNNDSSGLRSAVPVQMGQQSTQRLDHVLVAKIPRRDAPTKHRTVVNLRVADGMRILLRVERLVFGKQSIAARVLQRVALHFDQLLDRLALTGQAGGESASESIGLTIVG